MENQDRKIPHDAEKPASLRRRPIPLSYEEHESMTSEEQHKYIEELNRELEEQKREMEEKLGKYEEEKRKILEKKERRLIPEEVKARGEDALRVYNEELSEGKITVNHARLMFTGKEGVGKTCLVKSLLGKAFNENEQSTNGIVVWTTAFFCSEWKEETKDIEDWERTKQMLESTVEYNVAEKLKRKKSQTEEELEQAPLTSTTGHDAVSNPTGTKFKRGGNTSQTLPTKTLKRIGDIMVGKTSKEIGNDDITFMWDFAGQQLYYITHRIFLTSEAVYLILFNLMEGMHEKGKRRFSKMAKYVMTYDMTNILIIKYWMRLIFTYAIPVNAQQQLQAKKPQIVLVGTHSDCLEGTDEDKKKQIEEQYGIIFQEIKGTPYESHVVRKMYAISNKCASQCEMLETLKQDIGGFLKAMPKTIPLKWLKFQQILQENGRTAVRMTYIEVCKVATECGISVENLIHTLNYLHDLGVILYFENNKLLKHTVITNPRKLIFILKKIITEVEPDDDDKWPSMIEHWNKLDDEGILEEELVRHLWRDELLKDETCFEVFLELMKQFGLLCEKIMESTHRSFFVPCRLKRSTDNMAIMPDTDQMVSIYMASEDFIPDSIFHPLVVSLIRMVQDMGYTVTPKLFSNYASIVLGLDHSLSLGPVVIDNKPSLKLEIIRMPITHEDGTSTPRGEPSSRVCMQVLEFLNQEMKVLTTGMKHTCYKFRVLCWIDTQEMHFHDLEECLENDSILCGQKLIMTGKLQRMFKKKKPVTGNLLLPGKLKKIFKIKKLPGKLQKIFKKKKVVTENPSSPGPSVETADVSNAETTQPGPPMETADVSDTETAQPGPSVEFSGVSNTERAQPDGTQCYVDDNQLYLIAKDMRLEWKQLGLRLGLSWNKIQQVWSDNKRLFDCIMEMLTEWRKKQNYETNQVEIMCRALKDQGLTELANKVFGSQQSGDQSSHVNASRYHRSGKLHQTKHKHDGCLADTDFQFIAEKLDKNWKLLAFELKMTQPEIDRIADDFSPPTVDACIEMLVQWRSRQEAKINHLAKIIDALTNLKKGREIIKELKRYYQEKYN